MGLQLAFLVITRVTTWLRLSRREEAWQTAEILILRHQLSVLQRRRPHRPHLTWAARALLAALLSVIPKARRQGLRPLVTPDTILRWHRDVVRRAGPPDPGAAELAARPPAGTSRHWSSS
jgi:putative transposase